MSEFIPTQPRAPASTDLAVGATVVITRAAFPQLIAALQRRGYRTIGPTVQNDAIVYAEIHRADELPIGWTDRQNDGYYRIMQGDEPTLFDYVVGPNSWKRFLYAPQTVLWRARRTDDGFVTETPPEEPAKYAFIGVRACELRAIQILDKVLLRGAYVDPAYAATRKHLFVVAVNCTRPAATCFCASMGTGPSATEGYDLALTELTEPEHLFVVDVGSDLGAAVLAEVNHRPVHDAEAESAADKLAQAAAGQERQLDLDGVHDLLYNNFEHPFWDDVGARCLACGNCTMVCPTCFCVTVEDSTDLAGDVAERRRRMDSCFSTAFTYVYGGSTRTSTRARYRQWLTHKLAGWVDQFGAVGCVGCGRCITWCPVGIDLTAEVASLRAQSLEMAPETRGES
ncbi:MAG: 4Fe-4S dicluster domain-containing protein [Caldilineaceae bacterium]|nr:4Fe-4S dicluster domain-containing protein [Caldilineaceae bacterium]